MTGNIRFFAGIGALVVFVLLVFGIEIHYMKMQSVPFFTKVILFILLNLNLIALLTLMFFVGKSLVRVYLERKHHVMGYRLKTKLVVVLVALTMIPSIFLFVVSSGVMTRYLDRWFEPQVQEPLDLSMKIASAAYEAQRQQVLAYARGAASGTVPETYRLRHLATPPPDASETVRAGFEGKADVEVISGDKGDTIRAVAPVYKGGAQAGVVVVESFIGGEMSRNTEEIQQAYRNYRTLSSWKTPIKANYLLILGFFTLLTIFMALWVALRISRGITDPIQALAVATEQVARGNLDAAVDAGSEDEIGLLVRSFNHMVRELKESKGSLQRAWQESDRRRLIIENILENINSGVIFLDVTGNILTLNGSACRILELSPEDVLNKNYAVLLSMLKSEELRQTVKGIRVKEFGGLAKELKVSVGSRRVLLRVFITTIGGSENFLGTLVVFDDLTEIVRAQKAIAWEEVARRIAHEIKNPLTPIKLSTDHMIKKWQNRDDDFGQVFERSTKTIIREVESLRRLVNEFSRFGTMPEINKQAVNMTAVVESACSLYRDYRDVKIGVSVLGAEVPVELDPEQFKRVVINIIDNAIRAMQNQGRIDIIVRFDPPLNRVCVNIADNGPGIREEDREKLFLPYFSTRKDGTGLGLAIARRVVLEHKGYIEVTDNQPRGSIFRIVLPLKEG